MRNQERLTKTRKLNRTAKRTEFKNKLTLEKRVVLQSIIYSAVHLTHPYPYTFPHCTYATLFEADQSCVKHHLFQIKREKDGDWGNPQNYV